MSTRFLSVTNWSELQHYKDRAAPWVKLNTNLLDSYAFYNLSDIQKSHYLLICLLAAKIENKIPNDPEYVANMILAHEPVDLDALVLTGFLADYDEDIAKGKLEDWDSRYISPDIRTKVLKRANYKCEKCDSTENLEIDHILAISKGGSSAEENLQVLCRPCNRKKSNKDKNAA